MNNKDMLLRSSGRNKYRQFWFDLETTGLNPFKDEIIEVAVLNSDGETYESLAKPKKRITPFITKITNITNEMVEDKPDEKTVISEFVDFIKANNPDRKAIYLIGHNIHGFDMAFIKAKCAKYKIKFPKVYAMDTLRMAQYILNERYNKLETLCELFGIDNQNAHRAMSDVWATYTIYCNLCKFFKRDTKKSTPNHIYHLTSVLFT
jgi:DNA polymerase III epsilon subunit family exonuclease